MDWQVICDFDGTIAVDDVTDRLLGQFANSRWLEIERDWRAGRIGSRECMALQIALLECDMAEIERFAATMPIDPAFPAFVRDCDALGLPLLIVSDGLDAAIRAVLGRHGLQDIPIYSNRLCSDGEALFLEFPHGDTACAVGSGTCKCAVSARHGGGRRTLLIGDGTSDFCLARQADLVFAKDRLLDYCRDHRLPHHAYAGFADIRSLLPTLTAGQRRAVPARTTSAIGVA